MDVDPSEPGAIQVLALDKRHQLVRAGHLCRRKRPKKAQHFVSPPQRSARQLTDDEGMHRHAAFIEQEREVHIWPAEVVDPDRRVDEHALLRGPPAWWRRRPAIVATQRRKTFGALAGDQRAQAFVQHRRLFLNAAQRMRASHQFGVQDQRRSHAYKYA